MLDNNLPLQTAACIIICFPSFILILPQGQGREKVHNEIYSFKSKLQTPNFSK